MSDLTGAFKADVPTERQQEILDEFGSRPGVRAAGLIKGNAKSAEMRLLFYVQVDDDQASSVMEDLRKHADVAVAEVASRRGLA